MSALGDFGRLPFELREQVYKAIFQAPALHCCCCPQIHKTSETLPSKIDIGIDLCSGYGCANTDIMPVLRTARWSASMLLTELAWNPLTFLQVSKSTWREAESLAWQTLTFSVGLAQFKSFYEVHLRKTVRSMEPQTTRSQLLRNLHLTLPHADTLAQNIGKSRMAHGLSGYFLVGEKCSASLRTLRMLSNLTDLTLTLPSVMSMRLWEFKSFWPALVFYMPVRLAKLDVWVATGEEGRYFTRGDEAYLDEGGHEEDELQHRVLAAMILAAKRVVTGNGDEGCGSEWEPGMYEMSEAQKFCWEAFEAAEVPIDSDRMIAFRNGACGYL